MNISKELKFQQMGGRDGMYKQIAGAIALFFVFAASQALALDKRQAAAFAASYLKHYGKANLDQVWSRHSPLLRRMGPKSEIRKVMQNGQRFSAVQVKSVTVYRQLAGAAFAVDFEARASDGGQMCGYVVVVENNSRPAIQRVHTGHVPAKFLRTQPANRVASMKKRLCR